ncbi:response regulator [Candidatus Poribacteria bacterium]|nr:response regulator [Candidatus Poribacteria bacterium]
MPTILIVEDEDYVIKGMQLYCEDYQPSWQIEGYIVEDSTADPATVVAKAKACNADVVVLDMRLGDADWAGMELIKPLSQDNPLRPILICTVHNQGEEIHEIILNKGVRDYVHKDVDPIEEYGGLPAFIPNLIWSIEEVLRRKSDEDTPEERYKAIRFPRSTKVNKPELLEVQFTPKPSPSISKDLHKKPVYVAVSGPCFKVSPHFQELIVPPDKDSEEISFTVTPLQPGKQSLDIEFFRGADRIDYIVVTTFVSANREPGGAVSECHKRRGIE